MPTNTQSRNHYKKEYAEKMLRYFHVSGENAVADAMQNGLPSFVKFASAIGVTLKELLSYREKHADFKAAYTECESRLRDLLIDGVIMKKFDASFVRTLLQEYEETEGENGAQNPFVFDLRVVRE